MTEECPHERLLYNSHCVRCGKKIAYLTEEEKKDG